MTRIRFLFASLAALLFAPPAAAFNSLDIANSHVEGRAAARTVYNSEHKEYFSWTLIDGIGLSAVMLSNGESDSDWGL